MYNCDGIDDVSLKGRSSFIIHYVEHVEEIKAQYPLILMIVSSNITFKETGLLVRMAVSCDKMCFPALHTIGKLRYKTEQRSVWHS